jgi:hypothetical protein
VQAHSPDVTAASLSLLRLELSNLPEDLELPMITFLSSLLHAVWDKRLSKSRISLYDIRATLDAKCQLLRETRSLKSKSYIISSIHKCTCVLYLILSLQSLKENFTERNPFCIY